MSDDDQVLLDNILRGIPEYHNLRNGSGFSNLLFQPPGNEKDSWKNCSELVEKYDNGMCSAYREEIDTLLVFAGLFSAVVTAFTVESYKWLYDDASEQTSVQLLTQIANSVARNSTNALPVRPPSPVLPDLSAIRINTCWFLSLTLSLSAALVGILTKQWIREYERDAGRTDRESLGLRQMKFTGLESWQVSGIVTSVPLLLQAALALFLLGVLELLWRLNAHVALPITAVASAVCAFYLVTTLLPTIQFVYWYFTPRSAAAQCPYKSPQAWLVLRIVLSAVKCFSPRKKHQNPSRTSSCRSDLILKAKHALRSARSWLPYDLGWTSLSDAEGDEHPEYCYEALAWLAGKCDDHELPTWIWHCLSACTAPSRDTCRSPYNVSCVLHGLGIKPRAYPPLDCEALRTQRLLMAYGFETASCQLPAMTGILCQAYAAGSLCSNAEWKGVLSWILTWIERLLEDERHANSDESVKLRAYEHMVCILDLMVRSYQKPLIQHDALGWTLACACSKGLELIERSSHRDNLIMALCAITRRWLRASVEAKLWYRTEAAVSVLYECSRLILLDFELNDALPDSPMTHIISLLALDVDSALSLGNHGEPLQLAFMTESGIYQALVEFACATPAGL